MEIIIFIISIVVIINKMKNKTITQTKADIPNPPVKSQTLYNQSRQETVPNQIRPTTVPSQSASTVMPNQPRGDKSPEQQIQRRRTEERNTSILDRAKGNNAENARDVTLDTMETEHNHSERVAPAIHHHPEVDLQESMLGSIEDLMAKGYDGNLCFERDFLGEAMDMIGRFTAPCEMPDYSSKERA